MNNKNPEDHLNLCTYSLKDFPEFERFEKIEKEIMSILKKYMDIIIDQIKRMDDWDGNNEKIFDILCKKPLIVISELIFNSIVFHETIFNTSVEQALKAINYGTALLLQERLSMVKNNVH